MTLYTPKPFAVDDRAASARLMHDHPFATLITPASPEPFISHLPLMLIPGCEPHGMLVGHFARANPHWEHAGKVESVAIFHGPHAYVSPSWYAQPERMVPTWNYATVHAHGTLVVVEDDAAARQVLDALVQRFENSRPEPWQLQMPERARAAKMRAIVAFRLRIRRIEGKFKLSQNHSAEDRRRVAAGLELEGHPDAQATAAWMALYSPTTDSAP